MSRKKEYTDAVKLVMKKCALDGVYRKIALKIVEVIMMNNMFKDCSSLISLDLSKFDVSNVTNMEMMFVDCWDLMQIMIPKNISSSTNITDITSSRFVGSDGNEYLAGTFPKGNSTSITLTREPE